MYTHYLDLSMSNRSSQPTLSETFTQIGLAVAEVVDTEVPARATLVMFEKKLRVSKSESQNPKVSESEREQ